MGGADAFELDFARAHRGGRAGLAALGAVVVAEVAEVDRVEVIRRAAAPAVAGVGGVLDPGERERVVLDSEIQPAGVRATKAISTILTPML